MGSLVPYFQYTRGHTFKATATPPSTLSPFIHTSSSAPPLGCLALVPGLLCPTGDP